MNWDTFFNSKLYVAVPLDFVLLSVNGFVLWIFLDYSQTKKKYDNYV